MEKEMFLYMILDEIEKAKTIKEENLYCKEFYIGIESENKEMITSLNNNILFADKTIESLKSLIYLPLHEIIKNMSNKELEKYKEKFVNMEQENIERENSIVGYLSNKIDEYDKQIQNSLEAYVKYKKEKSLNEDDLKSYITSSKQLKNKIKEISKKRFEHLEKLTFATTNRNVNESLSLEQIREKLIYKYKLDKLVSELNKYKVTRCDEIVVNLCKDLTILDEIERNIKDYISLRDKSIQKIVKVPLYFEDYKMKNVINITNFILTGSFNSDYHTRTNEIVIHNKNDISTMNEKIEELEKEIEKDKNRLLDFKSKIIKMSKNNFDTINLETIEYILELCDNLYLTDNEKKEINYLYDKYMKLINKKHYNLTKVDYIEKKILYKIKNILDIYWSGICDELESVLNHIKNNVSFVTRNNLLNINWILKNKDNKIINVDDFSLTDLSNIIGLIENTLNKYDIIKNTLISFKIDLISFEEEMKIQEKDKENELNKIKTEIDELYYKISPNDFPILINDYDNINKVFKDKTIIDSIVKINRKNLISKIRSESIKYRENNELDEDLSIINKKVLK